MLRLLNRNLSCYVASMQAWQPARLAAIFIAAEKLGLAKSDIARIAGVHRSQVSRWASGEQRPSYDRAMRIAGYLERDHEDMAREFVAAAGYGGPIEPEEQPVISPALLAAIRKDIDPADQQRVIDAVERTIRGEPQPPNEPAEEDLSSERAAS